jgi:hypothetical protein
MKFLHWATWELVSEAVERDILDRPMVSPGFKTVYIVGLILDLQ